MAISAVTTWEVRTTGSDTLCSGGFVTGASGTDYSQQDANQYNGTNLVIDGAVNTKVTSATHNFVAADVGNILRITAGSGFTTGFFEIVSVAANAATLDRSAGTLGSTAGTFYVGGAFASPGQAGAAKTASNDIYIKAGTYTLTTSTPNVAGGPVDDTTGGTAGGNETWWVGYNTTRTVDCADTTRPTISAGAIGTITVLKGSGIYGNFRNIIVDCNAQTATKGIEMLGGVGQWVILCDVLNFTSLGFSSITSTTAPFCFLRCKATGGTSAGTAAFSASGAGTTFAYCEAFANACAGFNTVSTPQSAWYINCVASGQTNGAHGFTEGSASGSFYINCVAYSNAGSGFDNGGGAARCWLYVNCIAEANGGRGFNTNGVNDGIQLLNCAGYNNASGDYNAGGLPTHVINFVANTTGTFFVNAASGNFALNSTTNQGALARAAGFPGLLPRGLTTGYADIGVVQHQDAGGAGGAGPNVIVSSGAGSRGGSW